jgi:hypothetical protein
MLMLEKALMKTSIIVAAIAAALFLTSGYVAAGGCGPTPCPRWGGAELQTRTIGKTSGFGNFEGVSAGRAHGTLGIQTPNGYGTLESLSDGLAIANPHSPASGYTSENRSTLDWGTYGHSPRRWGR